MTSTTSIERNPRSDGEDLPATAKGIASEVADRAVSAAQRLPDAATAAGAQLERANQRIQGESDEMLMVGASLSLGLAAGLLLGGANRLLVVAALVPASAMAMTLVGRHDRTRTSR